MIEYTMLKGINDSEEDAQRLADLTEDIECKVNLIAFNSHEGTRFKPSDREQVLRVEDTAMNANTRYLSHQCCQIITGLFYLHFKAEVCFIMYFTVSSLLWYFILTKALCGRRLIL